MVSIIKTDISKIEEDGKVFTGELVGLSTDSKPTSINGNQIGNGTRFIEMDTGKIYFYNEDANQWLEF